MTPEQTAEAVARRLNGVAVLTDEWYAKFNDSYLLLTTPDGAEVEFPYGDEAERIDQRQNARDETNQRGFAIDDRT